MSVLVQAENVCKSYRVDHKTVDVLRGASLSVEAGKSVAVVGASGAGKSTLLHILGGLQAPDAGTVAFEGNDLYGSARACTALRARETGFVFQNYHLLPELDVLENTILPAMTGAGSSRSASGMRKRGKELLDQVGLADRANHTPLELSGGEQQRLALARALMNDPRLVLADEPTGNLDDTTAKQVLDYVFSLISDGGRTLVIVTHNETLAARCDRILHLEDGRLRE